MKLPVGVPESPRPERLTNHVCRRCGITRPSKEFSVPGRKPGGPPLRMCATCREEGIWWCNFHEDAHPIAEFSQRPGEPDGSVRSDCRRALVERQWAARGRRLYECESCAARKPSYEFVHVVRNYCLCVACTERNPDCRWCRACGWRPLGEFSQSKSAKARNSRDVRCDPCAQAHDHNSTVTAILATQGSPVRKCAACGAYENLHVDHDHRCCDGSRVKSCGRCIRGYLCAACNRAEGALRTVANAEGLLAYMRRWEMASY